MFLLDIVSDYGYDPGSSGFFAFPVLVVAVLVILVVLLVVFFAKKKK